jgi:hypothetical protein
MSIPLYKLTFHCRWTTEARLPAYLGSALRGALGWSLKRSSCALKNRTCVGCVLRQACAYAWIFETEHYAGGQRHRVNARPHPYVLQPGHAANGHHCAGESWTFDLRLLGKGIEYLPHIVYSVQQMGEAGIGAATRQGLGRFVLESVDSSNTPMFDHQSGQLRKDAPVHELVLPPTSERQSQFLRCTLHTPLRLKQGNTLHLDLPFHVLIRACLRRIAALETAYGQGEPALDYQGLVRRAEQVITDHSTLHWQELLRFSNRQNKKVSLSGLMGSVQYRGDLDDFFPLLAYASQVNLGKQTVFGLGNVTIDDPQAASVH